MSGAQQKKQWLPGETTALKQSMIKTKRLQFDGPGLGAVGGGSLFIASAVAKVDGDGFGVAGNDLDALDDLSAGHSIDQRG